MMLRCREARIVAGLSIEQVASLIKMHPQTLKLAELGMRMPSQKLRDRLSDVMRIPENILFWDWDQTYKFMLKRGGGLLRAIPEYRGKRRLFVELHKRVQENDD